MVNISPTLKNIVSRSKAKPVFVIGKGPSLNELDCSNLPDGLIVNLNDSERICAGTIGIFSGAWVIPSLAQNGFQCEHYLAGKPLPDGVSHDLLSPPPVDLGHEDMNTLRLEKETFFDESLVLLNAIKLALVMHRLNEEVVDIYFLGFDFSLQGGSLSSKAGSDWSGIEASEREAIIHAQESEFKQFMRYFSAADRLRLHHVGEKAYSSYGPARFNREFCGHTVVTNKDRAGFLNSDRVLVVAELTNNHLGDPKRLVEMVERSKEAGADLIKVQKRDVDSFYTEEQLQSYYWSPFGETLGDYRRGVELNDEMLDLLDTTCRQNEIDWFCSVLDIKSYHALERFNLRLIKVPSTISNHRQYHKQLAKVYKGAVVISTGYTESEYLDHVLKNYSENEMIYLLHCVSAYPTLKKDCNIGVIREYDHLSRTSSQVIIPGYSSHDLGSIGCMLAVASGARMLEKHVKLGDVDWVHFDKVAIDLKTNDFADFVRDIRHAEEIFGSGKKQILGCEHHKYNVVEK